MDNIVNFKSFKAENQAEAESSRFDELNEIAAGFANELLNDLQDVSGVSIDKVEGGPDIVYFVESLKSLVFASEGFFHPFQEYAKQFFDEVGVSIVEIDGGYNYVIGGKMADNTPSNDD